MLAFMSFYFTAKDLCDGEQEQQQHIRCIRSDSQYYSRHSQPLTHLSVLREFEEPIESILCSTHPGVSKQMIYANIADRSILFTSYDRLHLRLTIYKY